MKYYKFTKWVNSNELTLQLKYYNLEPIRIDTVEQDVFIYYSSVLSESQEVDLNIAVNLHDPNKPTIPRAVTPRQIREALVEFGLTIDSISNMINKLPEPHKSKAQIAWEYSNEFQRNNPLINSLAPMLNLTSEQIDQLFITAGKL